MYYEEDNKLFFVSVSKNNSKAIHLPPFIKNSETFCSFIDIWMKSKKLSDDLRDSFEEEYSNGIGFEIIQKEFDHEILFTIEAIGVYYGK